MQSRIDKLEILGNILGEACKLAQQLQLQHLPFLLEMAKLEFLKEVEADCNSQSGGRNTYLHQTAK